MSTYSVGQPQPERGLGWKVFAVFAGFLIPFVISSDFGFGFPVFNP